MGISSKIKNQIKKNAVLYNFMLQLYNEKLIRKSLRHTAFIHNGIGKLQKNIIGINNKISIGEGSKVHKLYLQIHGNNNSLIIGKNCKFGPKCSIWISGDNIEVKIDDNSTFTLNIHLNAAEDDAKIIIGKDCMFANTINVRTSDGHPIIDLDTGKRTNFARDVEIGNHVWVAPRVNIMKGAMIPDGCIVGSDTTVNKEFTEKNCLIVGRPAKIVKENISWLRRLSDYNG